jgi:hypothetical protein
MAKTENSGQVSILLISRLDFPSDGYRRGLLLKASEICQRNDARFVILAGGAVAERYVKDKARRLTRRIKALAKQVKVLLATDDPDTEEAETLNAQIARLQGYLDELEPEQMAQQLAAQLPTFKNAAGETVNIYVFPSPAYDGDIGEQVCQRLAELRHDDVRIYHSDEDVVPVRQTGRSIEVAVPTKAVWMRGDYFSTAVERVLKDRRKSSTSEGADLVVVGCFGTAINKQRGEAHRAYVAVPVLHRQQGVRVAENQIGVAIMTVQRDRIDPIVRIEDLKDLVMNEGEAMVAPKRLHPRQRKLVQLIMEHGRSSTGVLAAQAGLASSTVTRELLPLDNRRKGRRPTGWPGLRFDEDANRWDLDKYWLREHLQYPDLPNAAERQVDSIVAYGCLHSGCIYTDYRYFLEEVPRVMLKTGATILVGAGDFVEGNKHNLVLRGEVYGGMNVTQQEQFAGALIASVTVDVFRARFEEAMAKIRRPTPEKVAAAVDASLVTNVMIPGNHDLWSLDTGFAPLVVMAMSSIDRIYAGIAAVLAAKGLQSPGLLNLVKSKFVIPSVGEGERHDLICRNRFILPSGLQMAVLHPHMSRTKTTSIRLQEMLEAAKDCQVVLGANFHVAEFLGVWEALLGQRICVEIGTMKLRSDFEENKLKTVDHGFAWLLLESVNGRIVAAENTFYTGHVDPRELSRNRVFRDLLGSLGLKP